MTTLEVTSQIRGLTANEVKEWLEKGQRTIERFLGIDKYGQSE